MAGFLSRLIDANLTDHHYEHKGQEFGCAHEDSSLVINTENTTDSIPIPVNCFVINTTESKDIITLQKQDTY